jgi:UDP-glucose 4-epimerase
MNILVTGAAGYIGSVVTERLLEEGYNVIAIDNLQKGHRDALDLSAHFECADFGDPVVLDDILSKHRVSGVMHLAADSIVPESMFDPQKYFQNNIVSSLNLLNAMVKYNVSKLVFSSSAAVYGIPEVVPITEDASISPVSPYGESKIIFEKILKWYGSAYGLGAISLRYFNAAGATSIHGEHHEPETHLIPNVLKVALGKAQHVPIFGSDYETADGTCVRDYVHVVDIADAHLRALNKIEDIGVKAYNLGSEKGYSVLEVVRIAEQVTSVDIPVLFEPSRAGDPPVLVASSELARKELDWNPRYPELEDIINSAWQWQTKYPDGYSN